MKAKKIIGISAIVLLCAIAVFSGVVFVHQYRDAKNSVEKYDDLRDLIVDVDTSVLDKEPAPTENRKTAIRTSLKIRPKTTALSEEDAATEKYKALFEQNSDFVGWICIDGTNINYPVMWTPNNPNYYLKHGFDKTYSSVY